MNNNVLSRNENDILTLRFNGMSLDQVAEATETDRKLVRLREAAAMAKLRQHWSDQQIREHFEAQRHPIWE